MKEMIGCEEWKFKTEIEDFKSANQLLQTMCVCVRGCVCA